MTVKKVFVCSECGMERREANHWFVSTRTACGLEFHTWEWAVREGVLEDEQLGHLCGQECAHKLLDRFLTEVTTTKTQDPTKKGEDNVI